MKCEHCGAHVLVLLGDYTCSSKCNGKPSRSKVAAPPSSSGIYFGTVKKLAGDLVRHGPNETKLHQLMSIVPSIRSASVEPGGWGPGGQTHQLHITLKSDSMPEELPLDLRYFASYISIYNGEWQESTVVKDVTGG
jgi:hypothetical protein